MMPTCNGREARSQLFIPAMCGEPSIEQHLSHERMRVVFVSRRATKTCCRNGLSTFGYLALKGRGCLSYIVHPREHDHQRRRFDFTQFSLLTNGVLDRGRKPLTPYPTCGFCRIGHMYRQR